MHMDITPGEEALMGLPMSILTACYTYTTVYIYKFRVSPAGLTGCRARVASVSG